MFYNFLAISGMVFITMIFLILLIIIIFSFICIFDNIKYYIEVKKELKEIRNEIKAKKNKEDVEKMKIWIVEEVIKEMEND